MECGESKRECERPQTVSSLPGPHGPPARSLAPRPPGPLPSHVLDPKSESLISPFGPPTTPSAPSGCWALTFTWAGRSLAWRMLGGSSPAAEPLSEPSPLAMTRRPRRLRPERRDAPLLGRSYSSRAQLVATATAVATHQPNAQAARLTLPSTHHPSVLKARPLSGPTNH